MQTFLPIATTNYREIAKTLDNKRLNKQALEGWQILMNLLAVDPAGNHREPKGWSNHPAVKMWRGHESSLLKYIIAMVDEWHARGYKSTIADKAIFTFSRATGINVSKESIDKLVVTGPDWLNNPAIAASHRLALLVKDYNWYSQFNWEEDPGYPPTTYEYTWPVQ